MVTPITSERLKPSLSIALTQIRSAKVESRPPLIPKTTFLVCICDRRFTSPMIWILRISSHELSILFAFGINGKALISLDKHQSSGELNEPICTVVTSEEYCFCETVNVVLFNRSARNRSISI